MVEHDLIREVERVAFRAWPAREEKRLVGWILRATEGVTRRANSVLPLGHPPTTNLEEAIRTARRFYAQRGLPTRFQMTVASEPTGLDGKLEELGFDVEMRVQMQTAPLEKLANPQPPVTVKLSQHPSKEWLAAYAAGGGHNPHSLKIRREIMERAPHPKAYASAILGGKTVGVGFGVVDAKRGWLGLFGISTLEPYRRQGVATSVTLALARWARREGARRAYLQVEEENEPAKALYHRLGFTPLYTYWYRVLWRQ